MLPSKQQLSTLIAMLYDAAADPSLWGPFIEQLAHRVRATSAGLLMHDFEQDQHSLSSGWRCDPDLIRVYSEHYHSLDIWADRGRAFPAGYVCTSESLCPLPEMRTKEIYNDFMVKAEIEHGAFGVLENNRLSFASVSLFRDRSRPEFTPSDLRILQFLAPHLRRAFKLHSHVVELKARSAGIEVALDMLDTGIIFIGSGGEIVFMNRSAAALVAEKDGLLATRSGLVAERLEESSLLINIIKQSTSTSNGKGVAAGGTVRISRRTRPPLQILISPIHNSLIKTSQKICAVAFINEPRRTQRPAVSLLRTQHGLTPAECRVALLLSDGRAPKEIADIVGVTGNTVRSQIKSIFSKTGVKRQGELIRLVLINARPTQLP